MTLQSPLTIEEAAALLDVSVATVRRRCSAGQIKADKIGRNWIVDGNALPPSRTKPKTRRSGAASSLTDLSAAVVQLKKQDLVRDLWVPDVLRHEDDLQDVGGLQAAAADRIDGVAPHDPATVVPVPKSPFFPRNSVNLSLVDRLAYHAVVGACAPRVHAEIGDCVYSARPSQKKDYLLGNGRDGWLAWRGDVIEALQDGRSCMVSTDVTAYFDFIKHEILLPELQHLGIDDRLISSLRRMLKEWAPAPNTGVPQGPDASRVLGNFYMVAVDQVMDGLQGVRYFRYMDDIRIVGPSRATVIAALQRLDLECRRRGLALSTKKTEYLVGEKAIESMQERELDEAQYAFDSSDEDPVDLRKRLTSLFKRAVKPDGAVDTRWAKFSLLRLFKLREQSVLSGVLAKLESLAPLGELVPMYLSPWMRRPSVQAKLTAFLNDPNRNTSPYLSTWLLAAMLDIPDAISTDWVAHARSVALDKGAPSYHRAIALNVLALGRHSRDVESIRDVVRREHDPEVVRAALVALRRVRSLTKDISDQSRRVVGLEGTVAYLRSVDSLPSLIFSSRRNSVA